MTTEKFRTLRPIGERVYFSDRFLHRNDELVYVANDGKIIPPKGAMTLHRHMRLANLEEIIKDGKMRFESPLRWNDPFEYLFHVPELQIGEKKHYVACCCFTWNCTANEEGFWQVHGQEGCEVGNTTIIRTSFKLDALCKNLAKHNPDVSFYVADIDYSLSRDEILKKYRTMKGTYKDIDEYIHCLCLKRQAFAYENEIRIFAVSEKKIQFEEKFCFFNLKYSGSLVPRIMLPPLSPQACGKDEDYVKQQDKRGNTIRYKLLNEIGYKNKNGICQSRLYDVGIKEITNKKHK